MEIFKELEQGTQEWLEARCGIITAAAQPAILTCIS